MKGLSVISILFLLGCSSMQEPPYQLIKQGEVAKVEYLQGSYFASTKTIVNFKDGSYVVMDGDAYTIPNNVALYKADFVRGGEGDPLWKIKEVTP